MYTFELCIDIPKFISKNGELDDRLNSLEYQVRKLKDKLSEKKGKGKESTATEIYNEVGITNKYKIGNDDR